MFFAEQNPCRRVGTPPVNPPLPAAVTLPPALRPLRVLYADDVRQLRELMTLMLKREQHGVETVENGAEALTRLTAAPTGYDLLITDHHMPRLNGLELVRRARGLDYPGRIIVFSSELGPLVHEEYRRLNVDLILPKPVFPLTLRLMLRQLFASHYPEPVASEAQIY
ncbi:CheY chemotaxis protein or a CheY-like REC (receiver) domain [Opitutus sp. GAS368]|nr:CheY chemotaxis protein or a CheY-like REC (receiver) domain [Opitutus sp. GAS368]